MNNKEPTVDNHYFTILALLHLTIMVASTSVAYKPVQIWHFTATGSSILFASTFAISSIVAELYGKARAKILIRQLICCGLVFSVIVTTIPQLPSPPGWQHQSDFDYVFGNSLRFAIFGTIGSTIGYYVNVYLITRWKFLTQGKFFPLRIIGANTCGEFFLVAIATFGGFYGVYPLHQVIDMFLFAYLSKIVYALLLSWPTAIVAMWLKNSEQRYANNSI